MNRIETDLLSQSASGRGSGQGRGSYLFAAEPDRRRRSDPGIMARPGYQDGPYLALRDMIFKMIFSHFSY